MNSFVFLAILLAVWHVDGFRSFPSYKTKNFLKSGKQEENYFPFRDVTLSTEKRVSDLVSRLTLSEVVDQLARGGARDNGPAPAIQRLGIKPYQWTTECLHGYLNQGTIFPQAIGLAATFSKPLIQKMAHTISIEARAQHNYYMNATSYIDQTGLSCFAPVVNIMRHPLWGRNQETYGEDPFLTSQIADAYITGLQGQYHIAAATASCKHFGVHGGPENDPVSRFNFNSKVSTHDLGTTYLPAFRKCVNSGANGMMCSFNAVNGVPACANKFMMGEMLREKFGFKGYVVSDMDAIERLDTAHKYTKSKNESALAAILGGCDLELKGYKSDNRFELLLPLVKSGNISEYVLRVSAKRLFRTRVILGEFDPPQSIPWVNVTRDVIQSETHMRVAEEIATRSFVLLKNKQGLPLFPTKGKVAMIGPFSENPAAISGDYAKLYNKEKFSLPSYAAQRLAVDNELSIVSGCIGNWEANLARCHQYNVSQVRDAAINTDLIFVTIGTGPAVEAEGIDRHNLDLPKNQTNMLLDIIKFSPPKAKIIILLFNGGPVDIKWLFEHKRVNAILECFLPAQVAGISILKVVTGVVNPAGRLPFTWYKDMKQVPSMIDYSMEGRTYKYFKGQPLFPYGYGLSYTNFQYNKVQISPTHPSFCQVILLTVNVENTGYLSGEEVIQVYMKSLDHNTDPNLIHKLVAFERKNIYSKQEVNIEIMIQSDALAFWKNGASGWDYYLVPGKYLLYVGGQQPGQFMHLSSNIIEQEFVFGGKETLLSTCER